MTLSEALRDTIRERLQQQHWSQRDFAKRLGVTQGTVSYLLAGKRRGGDLESYAHVAQIFGLSLSAFVAHLEQRVASEDHPAPTKSSELLRHLTHQIATYRAELNEARAQLKTAQSLLSQIIQP
jgi:transcriptional regulator with XRE-family HTH domain